MTSDMLTELAVKLASPDDSAFVPHEKRAILDALTALAGSQAVIARQARLLRSYRNDVDTIDADVNASLVRLRDRLNGEPASAGYDLAKAHAARETLLAEIQRAESLEGVVAKILDFARSVAIIAA